MSCLHLRYTEREERHNLGKVSVMLVEELRLRKGSLAAADYLILTEQEVSSWQLSTTIYYTSGQIVGKDTQWITKLNGQVSQPDYWCSSLHLCWQAPILAAR